MNTITKTILGITVATTVGAVLGISLAPEQRSFLLLKIKAGAKDLMRDLSFLIKKENTFSIESNEGAFHKGGEITSELIDIDQYETYSSKHEL